MDWLHTLFQKSPEAALFLTLAIGYAIGKIQFGRFSLGGVAGSLLTAVVVSQAGVEIDNGVKSVMFALFIYAVGYNSGPQFFNSLNKSSLREIALAIFLAATALITVVVLAKMFHLDKGLAAGLAGGALTQSAIIGTAGDAIARLPLSAEQIKTMQANVAIGYAVTYVFGSLGAIIVCVNILPRLMGSDIKTDAAKVEAKLRGGAPEMGPGASPALPPLVGRAFEVRAGAGRTVKDVENSAKDDLTIEMIRRAGQSVELKPDQMLEAGDIVVIIGRRTQVVEIGKIIGPEVAEKGPALAMQSRQAVFTRKDMNNKTIDQVRYMVDQQMRHGVYVESVSRMGRPIPVLPETIVQHGDVITFYGSATDTARAAKEAGYPLEPSDKTDFVYLGLGVLVGLLIGLLSVRLGDIPLTLGAGGGALLSGLVFGWLRAKRPVFGALPHPAGQLLQDFGLAAFVSVVGLNAGKQALVTIQENGATIFLLGIVVTMLPLLLALAFARYVLRYDNAAVLAGALAGSRSANPAFGEVLNKADSTVPTVPFAITYALANVLLTLLGPLVVGLV